MPHALQQVKLQDFPSADFVKGFDITHNCCPARSQDWYQLPDYHNYEESGFTVAFSD